MKATRKLELAATLALITLYVGMAHVAAAEKVANALLAGGGAVSPALLVFVVALVVLRFLVVMVLPGVVAARLGLLLWAWLAERRQERDAWRERPGSAARPDA
ncbi:MAG: hypothetical protein IPQ09_29810 [Myxococcales bacterium]|nr:hypothetical protein [Myxococcales bacterium]HQY60581.1 hypothetical protein [Polyangiaceae bacterium]